MMNRHTVLLCRRHLVKVINWDAANGLILRDTMMAGGQCRCRAEQRSWKDILAYGSLSIRII